ncbi:MAG: hypothetical protein ABJB86_07805 [Bacteroidota bacterium]
MKNCIIIYLFLTSFSATAQGNEKVSVTTEQQLENLTQTNDAETKDDSYLQQLDHFKRHPLNLNIASTEDLQELDILTGLQIQQFLLYRKLLGKLLNRYELQAIPSWDVSTIKKILPFILINNDKNLVETLKDRWAGGDGILITRYGRVLEKSKGYNKPDTTGVNHYLGSPDKIFLRYTYNYKNLLQWGLLADKDAGEQFFEGSQKQGFDFYSFHFFVRKIGIIKALAIGDFTVNFGQGLIQWQSLAFKKSANVLNIKRQSAALRPYNSAGEYNFHRGAGITLQKANWETTFFASVRKISANTIADTAIGDEAVSSFLTSGYHRTPSEDEDRNSLRQIAVGANIKYQGNNWHAGINSIHYNFSKPIQKQDEPYNLFALQGSSLTNTSIDYSYTWRNIHMFGEAAADNKFNSAFLNGAIISMDAKVDASVVYRKISRAYQSVNTNAFTENTYPVNENGFYAGLSVRPVSTLRIDAYADVFQFPWLKYRVDAPSTGKDFLIQTTYVPNKRVELYVRYKNESKMINRTDATPTTSAIDLIPVKNLRLETSIAINKEITCRSRTEMLWYNSNTANAAQGFLQYIEAFYKPVRKPWQGNIRLAYFETNGYNARVYTYEADMPYNFSIPFYYDKGTRYYFNFNWDASRIVNRKRKRKLDVNVWLKWAQTIYPGKTSVGSYLDEIPRNHHSEIKCQLIVIR